MRRQLFLLRKLCIDLRFQFRVCRELLPQFQKFGATSAAVGKERDICWCFALGDRAGEGEPCAGGVAISDAPVPVEGGEYGALKGFSGGFFVDVEGLLSSEKAFLHHLGKGRMHGPDVYILGGEQGVGVVFPLFYAVDEGVLVALDGEGAVDVGVGLADRSPEVEGGALEGVAVEPDVHEAFAVEYHRDCGGPLGGFAGVSGCVEGLIGADDERCFGSCSTRALPLKGLSKGERSCVTGMFHFVRTYAWGQVEGVGHPRAQRSAHV